MNQEKDQVWEILETLPPASYNNDRRIVLDAVKRFERCPCDRHALILENYGFCVDHSDYFDHIDEIERNNHE